jgi:thiol-disulfide isomerase/thioredoxin
VNDVLVATPKDFGFYGKGEGQGGGRYAPIKAAAGQERFRRDLARVVDLLLAGRRDDAAAAVRQEGTTDAPSLPAFTLTDLEGRPVARDDLAGRPVLVEFWATWCPPCRAEMPSMKALRDGLLEAGVPFEIIAIDVQEDARTVKAFLEENGYDFPVFLDEDGKISGRFVAQGIPTSYLIDKEGKAAGFVIGSMEWDSPSAFEAFKLLGAE